MYEIAACERGNRLWNSDGALSIAIGYVLSAILNVLDADIWSSFKIVNNWRELWKRSTEIILRSIAPIIIFVSLDYAGLPRKTTAMVEHLKHSGEKLCRQTHSWQCHDRGHFKTAQGPKLLTVSLGFFCPITRDQRRIDQTLGHTRIVTNETSLFTSVDETTLLSELRVGLIAGPVGPLISSSARITVHGCTVYANVIFAVLALHLKHHRYDRKGESEYSCNESVETGARGVHLASDTINWSIISFCTKLSRRSLNSFLNQTW